MSGMTEFLKWALPFQAAKTQEGALYWFKVGHPNESEDELKERVAKIWAEAEKIA